MFLLYTNSNVSTLSPAMLSRYRMCSVLGCLNSMNKLQLWTPSRSHDLRWFMGLKLMNIMHELQWFEYHRSPPTICERFFRVLSQRYIIWKPVNQSAPIVSAITAIWFVQLRDIMNTRPSAFIQRKPHNKTPSGCWEIGQRKKELWWTGAYLWNS